MKTSGRMARLAFPAILLATFFMAFGPLLVRQADVGPVSAAFWRIALAVPPLLLLARWSGGGHDGIRLPRGGAWVILMAGFFFAADLAAWHAGIMRTKMANATLFGNSSAFLFALYGFIVTRSLPRPAQAGAIALAVIGAAFLLGSSYELSRAHLVGDLFSLLAGLFYAFYLVAIDRLRRGVAALPVLALSTLASALPLLAAALLLGERVLPDDWTPLLLLSLGSQVMGQGLLVYAIGHLQPVVVAIGLLTQPVVSAAIGWIAYDERLTGIEFLGAALISTALVLIRLPARLATGGEAPHLSGNRRAS